MNVKKIKEVLSNVEKAIELLADGNIPELSNSDLDCDGFGYDLDGFKAYEYISNAYMELDNLSYRLKDMLDLAAQNGEC